MNLLRTFRFLLFPFTIVYTLATDIRNYLYNKGIRKSFHFDTYVINVGNLIVGGSGKSPHIEYLARLLQSQYKVAILSRGYKRKTYGFIIADANSTSKEIGDEPKQFLENLSPGVKVAVGEERALAIPSLLMEVPETQIILLDDAYQHRTVTPDVNILLTEFSNPFYNDFPLLTGNLRERRSGAARANAVIVTKCPEDLSPESCLAMERKIIPYTKTGCALFFSTIMYLDPKPVFANNTQPFTGKVFLFSAIANAAPLKQYLEKRYNLQGSMEFSDHHMFSAKDIKKIITEMEKVSNDHACLITTHKDAVKLQYPEIQMLLSTIPCFYLPISVTFKQYRESFDDFILNAASNSIN